MTACDGKLTDFPLNDIGYKMSQDYYKDDTTFGKEYNAFADDYAITFDKIADINGFEYKSFYHVEDSVENYNLIKEIINQPFKTRKAFRKEK